MYYYRVLIIHLDTGEIVRRPQHHVRFSKFNILGLPIKGCRVWVKFSIPCSYGYSNSKLVKGRIINSEMILSL